MSWNEVKYRRGYTAADETIRDHGLEAALREYAELDGASAVNEFEVGFRTRLELATGRCLELLRLEG